MSAFTDDDLERWKAAYGNRHPAIAMGVDTEEVDAIIARLEAAELCIEDIEANRLSWYKKHLAEWRKASGKAGT